MCQPARPEKFLFETLRNFCNLGVCHKKIGLMFECGEDTQDLKKLSTTFQEDSLNIMFGTCVERHSFALINFKANPA